MSTGQTVAVDTAENRVVVENLTIQDERLVDYLSDVEPTDRGEALTQSLRIGVSALDIVETTKEIEVVERRFGELERAFNEELDELRDELDERFGNEGEVSRLLENHLGEDGQLDRQLEDVFGTDGEFAARIDEQLGEGGEKIQQALNPNEPGTPTHQLKEEIREVKEKITQEAAQQEVREQTRLKGFDFEEQLETLLEDVVHQTSNRLQNTSEQTGDVPNSKKGDFVVTLEETGQRIVVEAKNGEFNGTIDSEMEEAIENRDADYGIFVASSLAYLPRTKVGWFSEIEQDYVVVALSNAPDDELEPRFLKFAYHWARTRTLLSAVEMGSKVDPEAMKTELDGLKQSIESFGKIRTQCTQLEQSTKNIRSLLRETEDEITSRITRIESELGAGGS
jgi:hypothetical protein